MAKGILEFDLSDERGEHQIAVKSMDWALVAWDIDQKLRGFLKYGHDFKTADDALQATRDELHEMLAEHGVSLDDIE